VATACGGSTRTIGFGSSQVDGSSMVAPLSASPGGGTSLVVDVDVRAMQEVTLVGAVLACPEPHGPGGAGTPCTGSVKLVGLAARSGLAR
jgi:hypothetical protein